MLANCVAPNFVLNTAVDFKRRSAWGLYLANDIMSNVSGIIFMFRGSNEAIVPNPYAERRINDLALVNYL